MTFQSSDGLFRCLRISIVEGSIFECAAHCIIRTITMSTTQFPCDSTTKLRKEKERRGKQAQYASNTPTFEALVTMKQSSTLTTPVSQGKMEHRTNS